MDDGGGRRSTTKQRAEALNRNYTDRAGVRAWHCGQCLTVIDSSQLEGHLRAHSDAGDHPNITSAGVDQSLFRYRQRGGRPMLHPIGRQCPAWCDGDHGEPEDPILEGRWHTHTVSRLERSDGDPGDVVLYGTEDDDGGVHVSIAVLGGDLSLFETPEEARIYGRALLAAADQLEAVQRGPAWRAQR